jgi:hypothetical protein
MSNPRNGAHGASGIGPAFVYSLNQLWFIFLFVLFSEINTNTCTRYSFGIKMCPKLPNFLTIITLEKLQIKQQCSI